MCSLGVPQLEVEMAKGRKVARSEAGELLREWQRSGEQMSHWCARRGINWYSLCAYKGWLVTRWRSEPAFAEVVLEDDTVPTAPPVRYRVEVGSMVVEVDERFEADTLRRLMQVVATC